ncbi:MAG: AraC family transcriptional regulator [Porphyromonadaceae bacterium]|nr:AraC family transcriptional regulator [Porphyromonadaceae bacterium]
MSYNDLENNIKYLDVTKADMQFGVYVKTVGFQIIKAGEHYPLKEHPSGYFFNVSKGRVLREFQLLYITKGAGTFSSDRTSKQSLSKGSLLCLFPGQWHTYSPVEKIGWDEYYIGFNGNIAELWLRQTGLTIDNPVLKIGFNAELVKLFQSAIEVANSQKNAAQQYLSGIVLHILGLICYTSHNRIFEEDSISQKIEWSKIIMLENLYKNIDVEKLAEKLNLSYSWFRKVFKDYTGYAPVKYFQWQKIKKAEELLMHTSHSVKEISYMLNYKSVEHFFSLFKKKTGFTPLEYRNYIRDKEENSSQETIQEIADTPKSENKIQL